MLIGFDAPTRGPLATAENLVRFATEGEAMGFGYATFSDHIVIPTDIQARYPYSDTGEFPAGGRGDWHEQLTAIAFVAAKTSRLRFVTSVMVVPHRPAVLTAKVISTIDILSGGRITVGCGVGWLKEEFEAVGTPPFTERGAATDEYLQAFRALWTEERPRFEGKYVRFADIVFAPKPVQKPHPPLWIGGESPAALRRVARLGDGWYPIGVNPAHPLDTLPRYKQGLARLQQLLAEASRDPASVRLAYRCPRFGKGVPDKGSNGERRLFSGEPQAIAEDLRQMRGLGVAAVDFGFVGASADETLAGMKRFRDEVLSQL